MLRKSGRILFCSYRRQTVESGLVIRPHSGECSYDLFGSGLPGVRDLGLMQSNRGQLYLVADKLKDAIGHPLQT